MTFGETLRAWRLYRKETLASLAKKSMAYPEVIASLETVDVHEVHKVASVWEVCQISKTLSVTVEQLCEGIGPNGGVKPQEEVFGNDPHNQLIKALKANLVYLSDLYWISDVGRTKIEETKRKTEEFLAYITRI